MENAAQRGSRKESRKLVDRDDLTPMLRHYLQVKSEHPDSILLYRMGDFYETFFEDAVEAAPLFEIQLTARQKGSASEAPMCGIPHHALDAYVGKLLSAGRKVAICDQVEDPKTAIGLVKREVTRVLTPGTLTEIGLLEAGRANSLAALALDEAAGGLVGAFLDISTGSFVGRRWSKREDLLEDLERYGTHEVLLLGKSVAEQLDAALRPRVSCITVLANESVPSLDLAERRLRDQFGLESLAGLGLVKDSLLQAASAALEYARTNAFSALPHIDSFTLENDDGCLVLDQTSMRNLEVLKSSSERTKRGSLLWVLDSTGTAAGGRMLRQWLGRPQRRSSVIEARLDAVEELHRTTVREPLSSNLRRFPDVERLTTRAVLGSLNPAEAGALRDGLVAVPEILSSLDGGSSELLVAVRNADRCTDLCDLLARQLATEPPLSHRNGGVMADGVDAELDRLRRLTRDAKSLLLELEARERSATGIGNLKVRFNRVFGYTIEVSKANQRLVPEHYLRKQTLANAERYITEELKALESEILTAEELQLALEESLFVELRTKIAQEHRRLQNLAAQLAMLDVLVSFAEVSVRRGYRRPRLVEAGEPLAIVSGRHPVVEVTVKKDFVPNDTTMDHDSSRIVLITGPNMGGKSTYLRQVALISIMAHCGCFVPAESARIPLFDRIFTRVGASDNLARGESTFMVEMIETSNILRYATSQSLVILDEVGRGTSTFDGLSIAWAIVEFLHENLRARTLFATHYHELTELAEVLDALENRTLAVREWQDRIVFLHRIVAGTADKSYGIQVAKLAGLPRSVVDRAVQILGNLEAQAVDPRGRPKLAQGDLAPPRARAADQLTLFARSEDVVAQILREVDLDRLTPLAAMNLLQALKERLIGPG